MRFEKKNLYHVYNQGNDQQLIYFTKENYLYFLRKMRKQILPVCDILAYCLMPNHFHWLLYVDNVNKTTDSDDETRHPLVNKIAVLLRSYAQAINNQENRSGSLFRQKTKAIKIENLDQALICMKYIHRNPVKAELVENPDEWEFSSFRDYTALRNGTLVNKNRAKQLLNLDLDAFRNS